MARLLASTRARAISLALLASGGGCAPDRVVSGNESFPVRFTISNQLVAPVSISIDGTPYLGLPGGASSPITVPSTAQWLTWSSAKPMDASGRPIPDDLQPVRVAVGGINRILEITNILDGQTFITARFFNNTSSPVSIGVFDGTSVSCASVLPAKAGLVSGYTQIGYYRLLPATEIRAYREPSDCTGAFVSWPASELRTFLTRSGLVTLILDAAP